MVGWRQENNVAADDVSFGLKGNEKDPRRLPDLDAIGFIGRFMRTRWGKAIGGAALVGLMSWVGIDYFSHSNAVRQRHVAEATFKQSVEQEMRDITQEAIRQGRLHPGSFPMYPIGKDATVIDEVIGRKNESYEVTALVINYSGTKEPNPKEVSYLELSSRKRDGRFVARQDVRLTAPKLPEDLASATRAAAPASSGAVDWSAYQSVMPASKRPRTVTHFVFVGLEGESSSSARLNPVVTAADIAAEAILDQTIELLGK